MSVLSTHRSRNPQRAIPMLIGPLPGGVAAIIKELTIKGCVHPPHVHQQTHHSHIQRIGPLAHELVPQNFARLAAPGHGIDVHVRKGAFLPPVIAIRKDVFRICKDRLQELELNILPPKRYTVGLLQMLDLASGEKRSLLLPPKPARVITTSTPSTTSPTAAGSPGDARGLRDIDTWPTGCCTSVAAAMFFDICRRRTSIRLANATAVPVVARVSGALWSYLVRDRFVVNNVQI